MANLGFGLMRLPTIDGKIDYIKAEKMVNEYLAAGYNYFDTALMYHGGESEAAVKTLLTSKIDRSQYTVATKMHYEYFNTEEDVKRVFAEQLERTGAGYFDYYLAHDMGGAVYEKYVRCKVFSFMREQKEKGLIKKIGLSFHDKAAVLDEILSKEKDLDFVQLQINYLDWESEGIESRKCYEVARKHGLPITVMEPVKGGTLQKLAPDILEEFNKFAPGVSPASFALRFAASLPGVATVLSGMTSLDQMKDNIATFKNFKPLTDAEQKFLRGIVNKINGNNEIACTGCGYCLSACPKAIPIPEIFSLYNADLIEDDKKGWKPQGEYFERLCDIKTAPSECIECLSCENICPQHLKITENLKLVNKYFGK